MDSGIFNVLVYISLRICKQMAALLGNANAIISIGGRTLSKINVRPRKPY